MKFDGDLILKPHPKEPDLFITVSSYIYYLNSKDYCVIPEGVLVNGATRPFPFNMFFKAWHPNRNKSVTFHDAVTGEHGQKKIQVFIDGEGWRELDWSEASFWFASALKDEGSDNFIIAMFFSAVLIYKKIKKLLNIRAF